MYVIPINKCHYTGWRWVAFHPGIFITRSSSMRGSEQPIRAHTGESWGGNDGNTKQLVIYNKRKLGVSLVNV